MGHPINSSPTFRKAITTTSNQKFSICSNRSNSTLQMNEQCSQKAFLGVLNHNRIITSSKNSESRKTEQTVSVSHTKHLTIPPHRCPTPKFPFKKKILWWTPYIHLLPKWKPPCLKYKFFHPWCSDASLWRSAKTQETIPSSTIKAMQNFAH